MSTLINVVVGGTSGLHDLAFQSFMQFLVGLIHKAVLTQVGIVKIVMPLSRVSMLAEMTIPHTRVAAVESAVFTRH
jgi:hypothetical protein